MKQEAKQSRDKIIALTLSNAKENEQAIQKELKVLNKISEKPFTDIEGLRVMSVKELQETFLNLKYYISELGNQAQEIKDEKLFDTCVSVLKTMNGYSKQLKK